MSGDKADAAKHGQPTRRGDAQVPRARLFIDRNAGATAGARRALGVSGSRSNRCQGWIWTAIRPEHFKPREGRSQNDEARAEHPESKDPSPMMRTVALGHRDSCEWEDQQRDHEVGCRTGPPATDRRREQDHEWGDQAVNGAADGCGDAGAVEAGAECSLSESHDPLEAVRPASRKALPSRASTHAKRVARLSPQDGAGGFTLGGVEATSASKSAD